MPNAAAGSARGGGWAELVDFPTAYRKQGHLLIASQLLAWGWLLGAVLRFLPAPVAPAPPLLGECFGRCG
jgi:hypothetical protein